MYPADHLGLFKGGKMTLYFLPLPPLFPFYGVVHHKCITQ